MLNLNRRAVLLGITALPGCASLNALNDAATPQDTYALQPVDHIGRGRKSQTTLLVVDPAAPAALATDRILIRPDALSVTYLPSARWADDLPRMLSSVFVQSLSNTGSLGFVGAQGDGPIPDVVLLTRIDRFGVVISKAGELTAEVALQATLLRDTDQGIIATRRFTATAAPASDSPRTIALTFQQTLDDILPDISDWILRNI